METCQRVCDVLVAQGTTLEFRMEAVVSTLRSVPSSEAGALLDKGLLSDRKTCTLMVNVLTVALSALQVRAQPLNRLK
jgi:hypothetical protein